MLPTHLEEIAIGMILGDASIYKVSCEAYIKFEQGYKQEAFAHHLFDLFALYCFMAEPGKRVDLLGKRAGKIKSFWFNTFSHQSFTKIWQLFYSDSRRKSIPMGLVRDHLTERGLTYWIMCDGSLQNDHKSIILHTQGYTEEENHVLSCELNHQFGLNSQVIPHKSQYTVIKFGPGSKILCWDEIPTHGDSHLLFHLMKAHLIASMQYKLPRP